MKKSLKENALLRQAREERGWTQRELAKRLHAGVQTVGSWERGDRSPSLVWRHRLCTLLEKTPEQLGLPPLGKSKSSSPPNPPEEPITPPRQRDRNRQKMLKRVHERWIAGVLEHSLYNETLIALGLHEQPDAVANPWHLTAQETDLPPRPLPPGTSLTQVFDDSDGSLLILGEPGAGKTTLLLGLTRDLVERATLDDTHPLPVVFNLSSWAQKQQSLDEWLVEELNAKYLVPRRLGQTWIANDSLLLLLDGLDEVAEAHRTACIEAINSHRQEHGLVQMIVCSRSTDYLAQTSRVSLSTGVEIQPLTPQQIDEYISRAGTSLAAVKIALQRDPVLRELTSNPLMLAVMALTYHGVPIEDMLNKETPAALRQHLFNRYTERVLQRRGPKRRYSPQQTIFWLTWLASQLKRHNQTEFYIERIQPDWLEEKARQRHRNLTVRLLFSLESFLISGVYAWLRGGRTGNISGVGAGLLGWLGAGPGNSVLGWMAPGLGGGLEGGGMFGLIFAILTILISILTEAGSGRTEPATFSLWKSLRNGLIVGAICALTVGLLSGAAFFALSHSPAYTLPRMFGYGLFCGLIAALLGTLITGFRPSSPKRTKQPWPTRITDGLCIGLCSWIGFILVDWRLVGLDQGLTIGLVVALLYAATFSFGGGTDTIPHLGLEIQPAEAVSWDWRRVKNDLPAILSKGLVVALAVMSAVAVVIGAAGSLFNGAAYGWRHGLVYGPIVGLIIGLASIFTGLLNSGWSSSILDERQLTRPNEGIRRSLRNGLLAGGLFGVLGGLASGLASGLAFGLLGGLPGWHILAIGFAIVCGIIFILEFITIRGLIAYLEHYLLRWQLWREGKTPLNYARFLDYATERILLRKVGGGYIFAHRMLLEHFAMLSSSTEQPEYPHCHTNS